MPLKYSKGFKVTIGIIVGILGFLLFLLLVGFIIDCFTTPALKRAGDDALKDLMTYRQDEPGNAWNYYSAAIEEAKGIKSGRDWYKYLDGKIEITPEISKVIKDNKGAIEKIKEGAKKDYCAIPYDYAKGITVKIPDFMTLRKVVEIICMRSLQELERGQTENALDDIITVVTVGKHISSNAPRLLDQMLGMVFFNKGLDVFEFGLSAGEFDTSQLQKFTKLLSMLEKDLPRLSYALDGYMNAMKVSFGKLPFYKAGDSFLFLDFYNRKPGFFDIILGRFHCWRYFFSSKLSLLRSFKFMNRIVAETQEAENRETTIKKILIL